MSKAKVSVRILKDIDPKAIDRLKQRLVGDNRIVNVGVPEGKREADGTPVARLAAVHEFGSPKQNIPERPFLRVTVRENARNYVRLNRINLVKMLRGQMTVDRALGQLGEMAKGDVQRKIGTGPFTPLQQATIDRKGSSKPLIDTGQLVQSITWVLGKKDQ